MKAFWQLIAISFLVLGLVGNGRAQTLLDTVDPLTNTVPSADATGTPFSTSFSPGEWLPGRMWAEINLADNGLGYRGSFATLGGKSRLWQDSLDGRWLGEANLNLGLDTGGFFYNRGIERAYSIDAANSDVVVGLWFDSDNDRQGNFGHTVHQFAVNGALKTPMFDLTGNGYFPVGGTDFTLGDPTGQNAFLNHNIVLQAGIDSALQGFDATLNFRPPLFAMYNGSFQVGGYQYKSPLVDVFSGIRVGTSFRAVNSMILSGEFTYDDRFDATGFVQVGWTFGGMGGDQDYGVTGRDLEKTRRQAHVSRFNQDLILAINPNTGLPYNVIHVDNSVDPGGDGTFEFRFDNLAAGEAVSSPDDVIFVWHGDGTFLNQSNGIVLKDRQQLLGAGVQHIVQTQFGGFILTNEIDGRRGRVTNDGGAAVTLAHGNVVRGLVLDGDGVNMTHGILGVGLSENLDGGTIEDTIIRRATLNGITLDIIEGDWNFRDNTINRSGQDGININRALDPTSEFIFADNNFSLNIQDGLNMSLYDGARFFFVDNTTNGNARHGMNFNGFTNADGPSNWVFLRPVSSTNGGSGIKINDARGDVDFLDVTIANNIGSGIQLIDFRNQRPADNVFIGVLDNVSNAISGNGTGAGAGVNSVLNVGTQNLEVRNTFLNNNGVGLLARANNALTVMNTSIIDNRSISNNNDDGIRIVADSGASHNVVIAQSTGLLNMNANGNLGGHAVSLLVEHGGGATSSINADISNVLFTATGAAPTDSAIFGRNDRNALLNVNVTDVVISGTAGDGIFFDLGSNNTTISNINITRADILGSVDDGIDFDLSRTQMAKVQLASSTIAGAAGNAIEFTARGDSRSVLTGLGNTLTGSGFNAVDLDTFGTSEMLLVMTSNFMNANGFAGLNVNAGGDNSRISTRLENNNMSQNGTFGAFMRTTNNISGTSGGLLDIMAVSNSISANLSVADMLVDNSTLGRVCIAMSNNFFVLPAALRNPGAPADFIVELDGSTNGIGQPVFIPSVANFDLRAFGTVCEPAIVAQEGVFAGLGF
ncbi:MAG: right-handed parallel beta-helix repeat-containing protein [Planctomycetota bacterium]|nr:right-handed parallel beta-helix repeat-containing protein [Planctomycetota bacterium]